MDLKKIEILEKATSIFLRFGIKSVTMDDMARELGMSKKTLYNYFNDKNDLVVQIITAKTQYDQFKCDAVKKETPNAIASMIEINSHVAAMMKNVHQSVFYDLKKFHPEAMEILHNHKWKFVKQAILDNIQRGKREGLYRDEINEEITARTYVGATDLISDGEVFTDLDLSSDKIFYEIIKQHLFGLVNESGKEILIELINKYENEH